MALAFRIVLAFLLVHSFVHPLSFVYAVRAFSLRLKVDDANFDAFCIESRDGFLLAN